MAVLLAPEGGPGASPGLTGGASPGMTGTSPGVTGASPGVTGAYEGLPLRIVTRRCAAAAVQF